MTDVEAYEPASDRWRPVASLPSEQHHANAAAVGGKIFVLGGLSGLGFAAKGGVLIYDPASDAWSAGSSMPPGTERLSVLIGWYG